MKTTKQVEVVPVYVNDIPDKKDMEEGKIYINLKYGASEHLCLCGCGYQCYLPLGKDGWALTERNGKISLTPSILQRFACNSHYIITNNKANFV